MGVEGEELTQLCHAAQLHDYPDRLAGLAIPLGARIIAFCDAYDAMRAPRPYAASRTTDEALAELRHCAGSQFDPDVVAAFDGALVPRDAVTA